MQQVNVDDAKTRLPDLVSAATSGETVWIVSTEEQVVQLVPVKAEQPRPHFGSAAGLIAMADDFEDPLPEFREYME